MSMKLTTTFGLRAMINKAEINTAIDKTINVTLVTLEKVNVNDVTLASCNKADITTTADKTVNIMEDNNITLALSNDAKVYYCCSYEEQ